MGAQNFEQQVIFYHNIFVYCAIAALIFLIIAVALFFLLKIPRVFGEMTGRDAKKAIDEMMEENAVSGSLTSIKLGEDGRRRRKGRTGALATGRLRKNTSVRSGGLGGNNTSGNPGKNSLSGDQAAASAVSGESTAPMGVSDSFGSAPTDVPDSFGSAPTDVLDSFGSAPTDVLDCFGNTQTGILHVSGTGSMTVKTEIPEASGTPGTGPESSAVDHQPFSETMVLNQDMRQGGDVFVVLQSIVEIHTDEVI